MKHISGCVWMLALLIALPGAARAQHEPEASSRLLQVTPVKVDRPITIDGRLDEAAWQRAAVADAFRQYWPDDASPAWAETEARLLYDDAFVYVGVTCHDLRAAPVIQSLRRDIEDEFWRSDAVGIVLDPFNERSNGFLFGVNAGNAQIDGTLSMTDNATDLDTNWSAPWYSATTVADSVLYVEMAIPFSALQFGETSPRWRFNVFRNDMQRFAFSSWSHVPLPLAVYDLGHTGELVWSNAPGHQSTNIAVRPYAAGASIRDYETGGPVASEIRAGSDVRFPVSASLNLNATLNPDFSNVEVDEHVINLTRFDITLPEKRPFFLENGDIFSNFGRDNVRPFISRSIGLVDGEQVPISYGLRLTGNVASSLRVGVMNVQTRSDGAYEGQNYSMAAFQQQVLNRSQFRGFLINRQAEHFFSGVGDYNRVGGAEAVLMLLGGRLSTRGMYHRAFADERLDDNDLYGVDVNYAARRWAGGAHAVRVNRNYISDTGFIPRLFNYDAAADTTVRRGFTNGAFWVTHTIIPDNPRILVDHEVGIYADHHYDEGGRLTDRVSGLWYDTEFAAGHFLHTYFDYFEVQLPFATRLLGERFEPLPAGSYSYYRTGFEFETDARRDFAGAQGIEIGSFYNGSRFTLDTQVEYRASPRVRLGTGYTLNRVRFSGDYGGATLHLVGPQVHLAFSKALLWTTFVQYNTQTRNVNVNSRFQWRFHPMSDLFVVYNDNMDTHDLAPKNRGLTVKLTYWMDV